MLSLLFPPKCALCHNLLTQKETDLCHTCRENTPEFTRSKSNIPFIAHWTALWYYKDDVRNSIHRFKFGGARHYAEIYGRLLALKLSDSLAKDVDMISWAPISFRRKLKRGYDQSELLARAVGKELHIPACPVLKKFRHTRPQSGIQMTAQRRANVIGAYKVINPSQIAGKRILLLDDVVTTGSTASECARTLLTAGAKEVSFAAVAAAYHEKK